MKHTTLQTRLTQFFLGMFCVLAAGVASAQDVKTLVTNIQTAVLVPILNVVVAVSYLAGAGFIVASIFKFKAHKDNPTQITVGAPVMLLFVGVALLFFPILIKDVASSMSFTSGGSLTFTGGSVTTT